MTRSRWKSTARTATLGLLTGIAAACSGPGPIDPDPQPKPQAKTAVEIEAREFFSQELNASPVSLHFKSTTTAYDTTLTSSTGRFSAQIPKDTYDVRIDSPQRAELHSIELDGTFLVADADDRPVRISARDRIESIVRTVEDPELLGYMAEQWQAFPGREDRFGYAATSEVRDTHTLVVYTGHPACEFQSIERGLRAAEGIVCDGEAIDRMRVGESFTHFPGVPMDQRTRDSVARFADALQEMLNDSRLGRKPYDLIVKEVGPDQIMDYLQQEVHGPDTYWKAKPGVIIHRRQGASHMEGNDLELIGDVSVIRSAAIGTNGWFAGSIGNEHTYNGSTVEGWSPGVCTIRPDEHRLLNNLTCEYGTETPFHELDRKFNLVALHYVYAAQKQGFNPRITLKPRPPL